MKARLNQPQLQYKINLWLTTILKIKKKKNDQGTETKENGREKTKKARELTWIRKAEKQKEDEQELWSRFKELNNNFVKMKEQKKLNNKKKKLYL